MTLKPIGKNLEAGAKKGEVGVEISHILAQEEKIPQICAGRLPCKYHFSVEVIRKVYPKKHGFLMVPRYTPVLKFIKSV